MGSVDGLALYATLLGILCNTKFCQSCLLTLSHHYSAGIEYQGNTFLIYWVKVYLIALYDDHD